LRAPNAVCLDHRYCDPFAVLTQGDEVKRIDDQVDLLRVLGRTDTPTEAVLVAILNGLTFACPSSPGWPPLRGTEVMTTQAPGSRIQASHP
jgi:hypothetical protein